MLIDFEDTRFMELEHLAMNTLKGYLAEPSRHRSAYARTLMEIRGYIEDAESRLNSAIDALTHCPRVNQKAMEISIKGIAEARDQLAHLKRAHAALTEAEVYA
jgi:hypothetical protein